jgi:hypothetical protein
MFLKNFTKMIFAMNYSDDDREPQYRSFSRVQSYTGQPFSLTANAYSYQSNVQNYKIIYSRLELGTSNTPVEYNQYAMGSILDQTNDFDTYTIKKTYGLYEDGSLEIFFIVTCTPKTDLIIKEIGLSKPILQNGTEQGRFLIYREVLETPIQLIAGQERSFAIKIKYDFAQ